MVSYSREVSFFDKNLNNVNVEVEISKEGRFSICGNYDGGCGQVSDRISPLDIYQEKLIELWNKYHLNDIKAGTEKQEKALNSKGYERFKNNHSVLKSGYEYAIEYLESINLFTDDGYKYGSQWLAKDLPKNIISLTDNIISDVEKHNKKSLISFTKNLTIGEVLEDTEEYYNGFDGDILDSREIQTRIDKLEVLRITHKITGILEEELEQLEDFKDACSTWCDKKFDYGITLIKDDYFPEYAKEEAESCGYIDNKCGCHNPLNNHIDWESWANSL